ncbi:hypothetical protein WN51_09882 [Melipona quadrifasciata]|uniref:Uncharacterized protein n=1 Tax=Melipona quadrifasciata TaxID=166423 RepID=A0A0M8ZMV3_9HYME|nr:hypothetical protein WN51_09882 [Melipona quadrifasciata]
MVRKAVEAEERKEKEQTKEKPTTCVVFRTEKHATPEAERREGRIHVRDTLRLIFASVLLTDRFPKHESVRSTRVRLFLFAVLEQQDSERMPERDVPEWSVSSQGSPEVSQLQVARWLDESLAGHAPTPPLGSSVELAGRNWWSGHAAGVVSSMEWWAIYHEWRSFIRIQHRPTASRTCHCVHENRRLYGGKVYDLAQKNSDTSDMTPTGDSETLCGSYRICKV